MKLPKILIIDDKQTTEKLTQVISDELEVEIYTASNIEESKQEIESCDPYFVLSIVNPDILNCENDEIIKLCIDKEIPTIIFSKHVGSSIKEMQRDGFIIEQVLKGHDTSLDYMLKLVKKIIKNLTAKVLVVDDSDVQQKLIEINLNMINVRNIVVSNDGVEALKLIEEDNSNFSMIITDYEMPNMNGLELTESVRKKYLKDKLSIIGISATENNSLASSFLMAGANDYLHKPFDLKEFHTRVNNNLEFLWLSEENEKQRKKLYEIAFTDLLTKISNKAKYLMVIKKYCAAFKKIKFTKNGVGLYQIHISVLGLSDINKKYGYSTGNKMLQNFANTVLAIIGNENTIYRILSSEFVVISPKNNFKNVEKLSNDIFEELTKRTKEELVKYSMHITQYNPNNPASKFIYAV